ncbi:MAG: hypothetical protein JW864_01155 [Spirochaetes bacterium]|nr:hypothetical protein [Spirochaetota bacterium]
MDFTVLTTNIVNYTGLCEKLPEDTTARILNEYYFGIVHPALNKYDGELGNTIGDRQTAYWRNTKRSNGSFFACSSAIEIMNNIRMDQEILPSDSRFEVNIAITSGQATEFENTLIGETADLNSQLICLYREYKVSVLIDEYTQLLLKNELPAREIGTVNPDNNNSVKLYELIF